MATYDVLLPQTAYTLRLIVDQASQNIEANTSTVTWSLRIIKTSGTGRWSYYTKSWSVNIGGQTASGTIPNYDFRNYSELLLGSGSFVITHDADGTKTISNSGSFNDSNQPNIGSGTASGSLGLTTIPRASTPTFSAATVDAGTSVTINTNRASASFTHTVKYSFGAANGTIATGVGVSTAWVPPVSLLAQIPNSTTGTVTITLETYSGVTLIGTKSANFTLRAADDIVPTLTNVTATENESLVATEVGAFVKSLTRLNVAIVGAAGVQGSTISSYTITVAGQTISAVSGLTAVLGASGTLPVVGTIVDSRGRTASATINITVLDYVSPSIDTALTFVRRSDAVGTLQDEGTYLRVDLKAATQSLLVSATEKNNITYRVSTRLRGDTIWTVKTTVTVSAPAVSYNSFFTITPYAITSSWEVLIEVYDKFNTANTTKYQLTVATSSVFMHWGEGLGLGKFYETGRGTLDILGQAYQNDGQAIIDTGDAATTSVKGIVELATDAETQTGTDASRVVTPSGLASLTATTSRRGLAEIATRAEMLAASDTSRFIVPGDLRLFESRVIPTSMSVGSGSGSYNSTTGLVTFSGANSVSLNGIFTAEFIDYLLVVRMTSASGGAGTLLRVGVGTTDDTTNYQMSYMEQAGTSGWAAGTSSTFFRFGRADTGGMYGMAHISGPFQSDRVTFFLGEGIDTSGYHARSGGRYATAKSQTRLTLLSELGATFTGTMQVIGVLPA